MSYLDTVIAGELASLRDGGAGRNNALFKAAARLYQFVAGGALDEADTAALLESEGLSIGLSRREIRDTLKSARKAGARHPATVPDGERRPGEWRPAPVVAPDEAADPPEAWRDAARGFLAWAQDRLWDEADATALDYLSSRGLNERTALRGQLGYNPRRLLRSRERWGLPPDPDHGDALALPAGVVIPYFAGGQLVKLEIRGIPRGKHTVAGSANALWNVDALRSARAAMLVEGVFNGLTVQQVASDLVTPVALGAATHARRVRWIGPLAIVPLTLISTDSGPAGDEAAAYWLECLKPRARRWRPYYDDPNAMLGDGADMRGWVEAGIEHLQGACNAANDH